jgi:hypothetical protein
MKEGRFEKNQFEEYTRVRPLNVHKWFFSLVALAAIGLFATVASQQLLEPDGLRGAVNPITVAAIAVFAFIIPGIYFVQLMYFFATFEKRKQAALISTLAKLGWSIGTYPRIQDWPVVPSGIIHNLSKEGQQIPLFLKFEGDVVGQPAEIVVLDARYFAMPRYAAMLYIHIALQDSYPHTIVDGKDGFFKTDIRATTRDIHNIQLEGELSDYFTVFALKDDPQSALYTLTPDVLIHLLEYGTNFNIEVIGNSLYIFSQPRHLESAEDFAKFMNLAFYLSKQFTKRAAARGVQQGEFRYNSENVHKRLDIVPHFVQSQ